MLSTVLEKYTEEIITVKRTRNMLMRVSKNGGLDVFKGKIITDKIKTEIQSTNPYNTDFPNARITRKRLKLTD